MKKIKNKKIKKIICLALLIILGAGIYSYYNFHKNNSNKNSQTIKKEVIKNTQCFLKKNDDKNFRQIMVINDKKLGIIGGDKFVKDGKKTDEFVFLGHKEGDLIDVFSQNLNSKERVYKINKDGIIEGEITKDNLEIIKGQHSQTYRVKDIKKVKFNPELLIKKVDCNQVLNKIN